MDCLDLPIYSICSLVDVGDISFQHLVWKNHRKALFFCSQFFPLHLSAITHTLRTLPLFPSLQSAAIKRY